MKKLGIILISFIAILLTSCTNQLKVQTKPFYYFDTTNSVKLYYDVSDSQAYNDLKKIDNYLYKLDRLADNFREYTDINNLYYLNNNQGSPIVIEEELFDLIEYSINLSKDSNNLFNIAIEPIIIEWNNFYDSYDTCLEDTNCDTSTILEPTNTLLEGKRSLLNLDNIILDRDNLTITLPIGYKLTLGAMVKGYVADKVSTMLYDLGYTNFMLNFGNSSLKFADKPVDDGYYKIGLQDPYNRYLNSNNTYMNIKVSKDTSISTSGNATRSKIINDKTYSHIINPITLLPSTFNDAITVIGPNSTLCDYYSTMLSSMSSEDAITYINNLDNYEAIIIDTNKVIHKSNNFNNFIYQDFTK